MYDHVKNYSSLNVSKLNRGPVLDTFRGVIQSATEDYKQAVPIDKNHPFLMRQPSKTKNQCWATIIESGGFLDTHFHPPGWLSGVY